MLPMAGQVLAKKHPGADIIALSGCIIAAQLVMIGVAAAVGWALRKGVGRKIIFLLAFVTLPIRGILFTLTTSPLGVVGIQLLDGRGCGYICSDFDHYCGRPDAGYLGALTLLRVWLPCRPGWVQERAKFSLGLSSRYSDIRQVFLLWPPSPPGDFSFLPRLCRKRNRRKKLVLPPRKVTRQFRTLSKN